MVEDKLPFLESRLKEALYRTPGAPLVARRARRRGPAAACPPAARSAPTTWPGRWAGCWTDADLPEHAAGPAGARWSRPGARSSCRSPPLPKRTPYFCSGCPHNTSTRAEPDDLVGVGIGCHTMVALDGGGRRGQLVGMPQMGGEGAQWIGLAPFTDDPHFVQNLGDGTFHHSGSLAIRAAVAAGVNITYRLLYNDAVAMTGGQQPEGKLDVPALTRLLELEGVARVIVTTPEPERYRGVRARARSPRCATATASRRPPAELAATPGVTVLIHDDQCATEKRRLRKRGKLPQPAERVWINERVCEGCGDCGEKSSCLSVQPVQTEFGRKTRDPPGLVQQRPDLPEGRLPLVRDGHAEARAPTARRAAAAARRAARAGRCACPRTCWCACRAWAGTGVVTVSAILQMAAHLDGRHAAGLDQTGLAQKGGPVLSDVRIASRPIEGQLRAGERHGRRAARARPARRRRARDAGDGSLRERTVAVLNTARDADRARWSPTRRAGLADTDAGAAPRRWTPPARPTTRVSLDAGGLAQRLFGDHMPANMLMLGAAYQQGCLPIGGRGDRAGHRAQRHRGGGQPATPSAGAAPRWPTPTRRAGGAGRRRAGRAASRIRARSSCWRARSVERRAAAAARAAGRRADRLPGRRLRRALPVRRAARGPRRARADRRRQRRWPRPTPAGCTSSWPTRTSTRSPACTWTGRAGAPSGRVRPRGEGAPPAAPAAAAGAGPEAQAQLRAVGAPAAAGALPGAPPARPPPGPVRARGGPPHRARADRGVPARW